MTKNRKIVNNLYAVKVSKNIDEIGNIYRQHLKDKIDKIESPYALIKAINEETVAAERYLNADIRVYLGMVYDNNEFSEIESLPESDVYSTIEIYDSFGQHYTEEEYNTLKNK